MCFAITRHDQNRFVCCSLQNILDSIRLCFGQSLNDGSLVGDVRLALCSKNKRSARNLVLAHQALVAKVTEDTSVKLTHIDTTCWVGLEKNT